MKLFVLIPDGVAIRNFVYTKFLSQAKAKGYQTTLWVETDLIPFVKSDGAKLLELPVYKYTNPMIEIFRKAKQSIELKLNAQRFHDPIYLKYILPKKVKRIKDIFKIFFEKYLILCHTSEKRFHKINAKYLNFTRKTKYYKACKQQLLEHSPNLVFCTHQRAIQAIPALLAAQDLKIPTATFIYSWDNLPKATLFVEAEHYFVWSNQMKQEMVLYYPEINQNCIHVTGTPQFEAYFDDSLKWSKKKFCNKFGLNVTNRLICYSGDDLLTSPYDEIYLKHLAEVIKAWNNIKTEKLHIVLRRCPVDFSERYCNVLQRYKDLITPVDPIWKAIKKKNEWDRIIPMREDIELLINTTLHCDLVVNVGSTMAHDFSIYDKPCAYINYNIDNDDKWDVHQIYKYVHFRSMGDLEPVFWLNRRDDWYKVISQALYNSNKIVSQIKKWHERIAEFPLENANKEILNSIGKILS